MNKNLYNIEISCIQHFTLPYFWLYRMRKNYQSVQHLTLCKIEGLETIRGYNFISHREDDSSFYFFSSRQSIFFLHFTKMKFSLLTPWDRIEKHYHRWSVKKRRWKEVLSYYFVIFRTIFAHACQKFFFSGEWFSMQRGRWKTGKIITSGTLHPPYPCL